MFLLIVLKKHLGSHIVIVDGVWGQADVLNVPPQLRLHLHTNVTTNKCVCIQKYPCA